jgi:hypothetical protein
MRPGAHVMNFLRKDTYGHLRRRLSATNRDMGRQQIDKPPAVFVEVFARRYLTTKIQLLQRPQSFDSRHSSAI